MPELMPEVRDFEPKLALVGEDADGLGHHRRLLAQAAALVDDGGFVALEMGSAQGALMAGLGVAGLAFESVQKDLARNDRVAVYVRAP